MRVIKPYPIKFTDQKFQKIAVVLPNSHTLLSVHPSNDGAFLYFLVDPDAKLTTRTVAVAFTDVPVPEDVLNGFRFVGSYVLTRSELPQPASYGNVFHIWENIPG